MSAVSTRSVVPRPAVRKSVAPPSPPSSRAVPQLSLGRGIPNAHESSPPIIRDRLPTLELADEDLVEAQPVAVASRSAPPPPPPPSVRSAIVQKLSPVPAALLEQMGNTGPLEPRLGSALDPTEILFEGMYELELVDGSWQAASVCAAALARALGARAVLVHSHDLSRRELRTIGVHGDRTADLLGSTDLSDDDIVASAVFCNEKAVTMRFEGELPRLAPLRLAILGAPRTLVAVPAMAWGRCVGMIEIVDPDERFAGRVADAALYVAERFAAFLSGRLAA